MIKRCHILVAFAIILTGLICISPTAATDPGRIAFNSEKDGLFQAIYIMNADGTGQTRITGRWAQSPAFSPDGSKIAFSVNEFTTPYLYVINSDGTGLTRLTFPPDSGGGPTWSPDGKKIAFVSGRDGNGEIYMMNADGSGQTRLTFNTVEDSFPDWSPDGSRIAFTSRRDGSSGQNPSEIYVMNIDGSEQTRLTFNIFDDFLPAWSPDSSLIAFTSNRGGPDGIYIMKADGSEETRLTSASYWSYNPDWSPDGNRIVFHSRMDDPNNVEIYTMNVDGSDIKRLTFNTGWDAAASWGPTYITQMPPIADAGGPYDGVEGTGVAFSAAGSSGMNIAKYEWDLDNDGEYDDAESVSATNTWYDGPISAVIGLRVTDAYGQQDTDSTTVAIANVAPTISSIIVPLIPMAVGIPVSASANFIDPGSEDTHTATWTWDDGTTSPGTVVTGSVSGTHTYTVPRVYQVKVTVTDDDGGSATATAQTFLVVYDPNGGFVTGGGWIDSPAGAYTVDATMTGKATFGFVSKYQKGATVPTGQTQFVFKAADFTFHSTSYDWLVIAGTKAQYKGSGMVNGAGDYGFMLTAVDGDVLGKGKPDLFRLKIWDTATNTIVYDNKMNAPDTDDPTTVLGGGSIVVHKN